MKNYSYATLAFFLAFLLSISLSMFMPCFQKDKEIYNSKISQNKSISISEVIVPEMKNQNADTYGINALTTGLSTKTLALKIYLSIYYKKVPDEIEDVIIEAVDNLSRKHQMDFNLIVGIIGVESSFNPYATSKKGARGLMQVRYGVWKDHLKIPNVMILHNIHEGIEYGILAFLQCKKEAKGNLKLALQKYNGAKGSDYINKVDKEINRFILLRQNEGEPINAQNQKNTEKERNKL